MKLFVGDRPIHRMSCNYTLTRSNPDEYDHVINPLAETGGQEFYDYVERRYKKELSKDYAEFCCAVRAFYLKFKNNINKTMDNSNISNKVIAEYLVVEYADYLKEIKLEEIMAVRNRGELYSHVYKINSKSVSRYVEDKSKYKCLANSKVYHGFKYNKLKEKVDFVCFSFECDGRVYYADMSLVLEEYCKLHRFDF